MLYSNVFIESFGYELAPHVVTSEELERRIEPVYKALHLKIGQLKALTGIHERRFWDPGFKMSHGAILAGEKAIGNSNISPESIGMLIYGGVCRDNLEPATACVVSHALGMGPQTIVYDISNACLGMINGMMQIANAIELGQIKAGLVVSCESAREIVDVTINRMLESRDMEVFKKTVATLTGGSGAAAVLLVGPELASEQSHRLLGGVGNNANEYHGLCIWGPDTGIPPTQPHALNTDPVGVLKNGVVLGQNAFNALKQELSWDKGKPDKIICHQIGASNQATLLKAIGIPSEKDFPTYPYLGNIGTVSLPLTAAIADEREFLEKGDIVGLLGIGSGLNCLLLGAEW